MLKIILYSRRNLNYFKSNVDHIQFEKGPLLELTRDLQVNANKHYSFWKCMDAMRDKIELEDLWNSGRALWKIWI